MHYSHRALAGGIDRFSPVRLLTSVTGICILLTVAFTATNISITICGIVELRKLTPPAPLQYSYVGDDWPAQLPLTLGTVGHTVSSLSDTLSLYDDDAWGSVFPSNGFIRFGEHKRAFAISMIHQIHCLDGIRVGFVTNRTGSAGHVQHCLRYLLQAVLCAADTTLEEDILSTVTGRPGANGVGMVHRCRDWKAVMNWLTEHSSENDTLAAPHRLGLLDPDLGI